MAAEAPRVAVVGGGIAGLLAVIMLRARGIHGTVFEQSPAFEPVGAGVQLSPNGARVLRRIGLAGALAADGVVAQAIETRRWRDGAPIARTPLGAGCADVYGAPYITIHRADLHRALAGLVPPESVRLGRRCVDLVEKDAEVELRFADGSTATADVVLAADGVHSALRDLIIGDTAAFSGHVVYRGLVPAAAMPGLFDEPKVMFWLGPARHVTAYPISRGELYHFSAVVTGEAAPDSADVDTAELVREFADWDPGVRDLVRAPDTVSRWGLYDRDIAARWGTRRLVLIGDAAHPMLPYMSQGANQAIEDVTVLVRCLTAFPGDIETAVRAYEERRLPRVTEIHRRSRRRGVLFHHPDGALQRERDVLFKRTESLADVAWLYGYDAESDASGA